MDCNWKNFIGLRNFVLSSEPNRFRANEARGVRGSLLTNEEKFRAL